MPAFEPSVFPAVGLAPLRHSFPTRRSSDLFADLWPQAWTAKSRARAGGQGAGATRHILLLSTANDLRSEEHTSELQSRLHLVCRPLLEKKELSCTSDASRGSAFEDIAARAL